MSEKILIVDDNKTNLEFFSEIFSIFMSEYELLVSTGGEEALQILSNHKPSLILLDIQMPGLTGFDVLEQIKAQQRLSDVPVVALSAFAMDQEIQRALSIGFTGYITKPVRIKEFVSKVKQYICPVS